MKKITAVLISLLMVLSVGSFTGGCGKDKNVANTLYIECSNAGFGQAWLDSLIELFKESHPGVRVEKTALIKQDASMVEKVLSGVSETDLFFVETNYARTSADKHITVDGVNYDSPYMEISDILNAKVPGEDITMKDKMDKSYYTFQTSYVNGEERHYLAPWMQAPVGIAINKNIYTKDKFGRLPNTTNEFVKFCDHIKEKGAVPFIYSLSASYWDLLYDCWMAQYLGKEDFARWFDGYDVKTGERYIPEMFLNEGLLYSLQFMEKILTPENNYASEMSYNLPDFTSVQNRYLEGMDNILMMPTGAWLEREMEANYEGDELNIEYIPFPVISELGTKLGITDDELSAIIDYVDGTTTTKPSFISKKSLTEDEVINAVSEARHLNPSLHEYHAFIPAYGKKISLAKEFLQMMATDKGMEVMLKACGSCTPYKYDIETSPVKGDLSPFMLSINRMANSGYFFVPESPIFTKGGLTYINGVGNSVSIKFAAPSKKDRMSALTLYNNNYKNVKDRWDSILETSGVEL